MVSYTEIAYTFIKFLQNGINIKFKEISSHRYFWMDNFIYISCNLNKYYLRLYIPWIIPRATSFYSVTLLKTTNTQEMLPNIAWHLESVVWHPQFLHRNVTFPFAMQLRCTLFHHGLEDKADCEIKARRNYNPHEPSAT